MEQDPKGGGRTGHVQGLQVCFSFAFWGQIRPVLFQSKQFQEGNGFLGHFLLCFSARFQDNTETALMSTLADLFDFRRLASWSAH
jgi:hypothetical protein